MTPEEVDNILRSFMHELYQRSPFTRRQYHDSVMHFYAWAEANGCADRFPFDLKRRDVVGWMAEYATTPTKKTGQLPKAATLRHLYAGSHAFFVWLEKEAGEEWLNPFAKLDAPTVPEQEKPTLSPETVRDVLETLDRRKAYREAAMVSLIYDNGMRARSLVNIKVEDVDWEDSGIMLGHTKGGRRLSVPFSNGTWRRLDRWQRNRKDKDGEWLFTGTKGKLTTSGVLQIIKRTFSGLAIEGVGPHMIRHSFATAYMSSDEAQWQDLKEIGLWTSDTMPQRYAKGVKRQRAREAHRHLSPVERLDSLPKRMAR